MSLVQCDEIKECKSGKCQTNDGPFNPPIVSSSGVALTPLTPARKTSPDRVAAKNVWQQKL